MIIYKKGRHIIINDFPYGKSFLSYQLGLDDYIRLFYVGKKVGTFRIEHFKDKQGNSFVDLISVLNSFGLNEFKKPLTELEIESEMYEKRIIDGVEMSKSLMAELRVNSKTNNLPRAVNKYIEDKLDKVKINIDRGWWVTALEELEATTVELYFTQELYDRIHLSISSYITENY